VAETSGDGRDLQATATMVAGEGSRREVRARGGGTGLGRFDRPRTQSVGLDPARWAGLANGPRPKF
jgi:hypothetical protein